MAVIQCDGGRVKVRDDCRGKDKPEGKRRRWWLETQAGVLQTYRGKPGCEGPTPDVPECFKDSLWVVPKLNEIHRGQLPTGNSDTEESQSPADQQENIRETTGNTKAEPETIGTSSRTARWSGGEPLVKSIVATRRGYDHLGRALAGEAFGRGFNKAISKAFMGDGLKVTWSVFSKHFSRDTAITDLMHALSDVYPAAIASCGRIEDGWSLYLH